MLASRSQEFEIARQSAFRKRAKIEQLISTSTSGSSIWITGGTGWFGSSLLSLLQADTIHRLAVSSSKGTRFFEFGEVTRVVENPYPIDRLEGYDLCIDLAFRTRDQIRKNLTFGGENSLMVSNAKLLMQQNLVKRYVGVSSGAAVYKLDRDLYSEEKRHLEDVFSSFGRPKDSLIRAWSVSGSHCAKTEVFAFANFINQAMAGQEIIVKSSHPVWRRYCAVEELLGISISGKVAGLIESGGELIEVGELARRIGALLAPNKAIIRTEPEANVVPNFYHSDGGAFAAHMKFLGLEPMTLEEQIANSLLGFGGSESTQ